jgi:hypothetical protein
MIIEEQIAKAFADAVKDTLNSLRITLAAHEARLVGLESGGANAELKRQIDELKKQLEASRQGSIVKLRSTGGGA